MCMLAWVTWGMGGPCASQATEQSCRQRACSALQEAALRLGGELEGYVAYANPATLFRVPSLVAIMADCGGRLESASSRYESCRLAGMLHHVDSKWPAQFRRATNFISRLIISFGSKSLEASSYSIDTREFYALPPSQRK